MPLRFSRAQRLTHAREFQRVFGGRASVARGPGGCVRVHALPNGLDRPRLGLSIGRRVGGAVVRNRLKRLIREAFRLEQTALPAGLDFVVSLLPHAELGLEAYRACLRDGARALAAVWARRGTAPAPTRTPEPRGGDS